MSPRTVLLFACVATLLVLPVAAAEPQPSPEQSEGGDDVPVPPAHLCLSIRPSSIPPVEVYQC